MTMDFPAPVSPVSRTSPGPSSSSSEGMSAMLLILSSLSIAARVSRQNITAALRL